MDSNNSVHTKNNIINVPATNQQNTQGQKKNENKSLLFSVYVRVCLPELVRRLCWWVSVTEGLLNISILSPFSSVEGEGIEKKEQS